MCVYYFFVAHQITMIHKTCVCLSDFPLTSRDLLEMIISKATSSLENGNFAACDSKMTHQKYQEWPIMTLQFPTTGIIRHSLYFLTKLAVVFRNFNEVPYVDQEFFVQNLFEDKSTQEDCRMRFAWKNPGKSVFQPYQISRIPKFENRFLWFSKLPKYLFVGFPSPNHDIIRSKHQQIPAANMSPVFGSHDYPMKELTSKWGVIVGCYKLLRTIYEMSQGFHGADTGCVCWSNHFKFSKGLESPTLKDP